MSIISCRTSALYRAWLAVASSTISEGIAYRAPCPLIPATSSKAESRLAGAAAGLAVELVRMLDARHGELALAARRHELLEHRPDHLREIRVLRCQVAHHLDLASQQQAHTAAVGAVLVFNRPNSPAAIPSPACSH